MIVVRIMGGLGNQMFQYAAGKRLALKLGVEMRLDTDWYDRSDSRLYELGFFQVPEVKAGRSDIRRLRYGSKPWWKLLTNRARREAKESSTSHIKQKQFHFDTGILNLSDDVYLHGYWQSEKYFKDIERDIRDQFTFRNPGKSATEMAERIHSSNSVSIHIRRGDYIEGDSAAKFENLPLEYYRKALHHLESSLGLLDLFIFSDDLTWVRENNLFDREMTFVEASGNLTPVDDMWLMTLCRHNIIANSSFSWWGAWLNSNETKTVVAPSIWFKSEENDTRDLIPETWIRL
jgi:hypothetical protein